MKNEWISRLVDNSIDKLEKAGAFDNDAAALKKAGMIPADSADYPVLPEWKRVHAVFDWVETDYFLKRVRYSNCPVVVFLGDKDAGKPETVVGAISLGPYFRSMDFYIRIPELAVDEIDDWEEIIGNWGENWLSKEEFEPGPEFLHYDVSHPKREFQARVLLSENGRKILKSYGYELKSLAFELGEAEQSTGDYESDANEPDARFDPAWHPARELLKAAKRLAIKDALDTFGPDIVSVHLHRVLLDETGRIYAEYAAELETGDIWVPTMADNKEPFLKYCIDSYSIDPPESGPLWLPGKYFEFPIAETLSERPPGFLNRIKPYRQEIISKVKEALPAGLSDFRILAITLSADGELSAHFLFEKYGNWVVDEQVIVPADALPGEAYETDCWTWAEYNAKTP